MSEEQFPLPWNPDENCKINKKKITTRLESHPDEEVVGNLFDRECEGLDNSIPRRKDNFVDCVSIPEVPKAKLVKEDYDLVPFPGLPEVEIPKRLLSHLLSCCLEGRSAGFSFEVEQELEWDESKQKDVKVQIGDVSTATTTLSIRLGTFGTLIFGLNIKPYSCFCDETCGDEDYIHIKVNLDASYIEGDWIIEHPHDEPDVYITDEQLTNFIGNYGGGGGNPLCSQKMFAVYQGGNSFIPYNGVSEIVDAPVSAELAPYLSNTTLVQNAVYKLEYFCEDATWYVTDGACGTLVPTYTGRADRVTSAEGLAGSQWTGYFILDSPNAYDLICEFEEDESTTTPAAAFENGISFSISPGPNNNPRHAIMYSFILKEGASGGLVYYATVMDAVSCRSTTYRLVIRVKEIPLEEEVEEENESEEAEQQTNENE